MEKDCGNPEFSILINNILFMYLYSLTNESSKSSSLPPNTSALRVAHPILYPYNIYIYIYIADTDIMNSKGVTEYF